MAWKGITDMKGVNRHKRCETCMKRVNSVRRRERLERHDRRGKGACKGVNRRITSVQKGVNGVKGRSRPDRREKA